MMNPGVGRPLSPSSGPIRSSWTGMWASSTRKLVSRFHLPGDERPAELCTPPIFMAFDVLQTGRRDVRGLPLEQRRMILDDVAADVVDTVPLGRRLDGDGAKAWATVEERRYEGMVAKAPRSTYQQIPIASPLHRPVARRPRGQAGRHNCALCSPRRQGPEARELLQTLSADGR